MTNKPFTNFLADFNTLAARCSITDKQNRTLSHTEGTSPGSPTSAPGVPSARRSPTTSRSRSTSTSSAAPALAAAAPRPPGLVATPLASPRSRRPGRPSSAPRPRRPGSVRTASARTALARTLRPSALSRRPQAVDLSAMRPNREQCAQQGLCFYCKQPGQVESQCAERTYNESRRNNQLAARAMQEEPATEDQPSRKTSNLWASSRSEVSGGEFVLKASQQCDYLADGDEELRLSALGSKSVIETILSSAHLNPVTVRSLVDSGCSAPAFIDYYRLVGRYKIPWTLLKRRTRYTWRMENPPARLSTLYCSG